MTGPGVIPSAGGSYFVDVEIQAGASWATGTASPWITSVGSGGTGPGRFSFAALSNSGDERTGAISAAGQSVAITQHGAYSNNSALVRQYYRDLLGREPDAVGLTYWVMQLDGNSLSRDSLAAQFFLSPEFGQRGLLVIKTYSAVLGRMPEYAGFRYWLSRLASGLPMRDMMALFMDSQEYQQRFGNTDNPTFVTLMYQNVLGRSPDPGGLGYWKGLLDSGAATRADVVYGFIVSEEVDNKIRNPAYSQLLYIGFLARDPDPAG